MKIAYIGNQGGREVYGFYAGMARVIQDEYAVFGRFAVWLESERFDLVNMGFPIGDCLSFESYIADIEIATDEEIDRLVHEYKEVNWSEVIAAERAFTDYSMLLGAAGERRETPEYVRGLVVAIVRFLEKTMEGCSATKSSPFISTRNIP